MKSNHLFLTLVILILFFGCQAKENKTVPDELVGVWRTSAPKYEDCYLELTKDLIIFVNENILQNMDANSIYKIKKADKDKNILYTIYYKNDEGLKYQFSFYYDPSGGSVIKFKHQTQIEWTKEGKEENSS